MRSIDSFGAGRATKRTTTRRTRTVRELAEILGVGINKAYALLQRGDVRFIQVGNARLIPVVEIARLLGERAADADQSSKAA